MFWEKLTISQIVSGVKIHEDGAQRRGKDGGGHELQSKGPVGSLN